MSVPVIWSWQSTAPFIIAEGRYGDSVISGSHGRWPVSHGPHTLQEGFGLMAPFQQREKCREVRLREDISCLLCNRHLFPALNHQHEPVLMVRTHSNLCLKRYEMRNRKACFILSLGLVVLNSFCEAEEVASHVTIMLTGSVCVLPGPFQCLCNGFQA